ncbi:MAG: hypothetical protein HYT81_04570 [Gemmatimonadetes bacterium]|nr:hypothetical protein [Gemmatimonadota bacterium]
MGTRQATASPGEAHRTLAAADIERFLERRALPTSLYAPLPVPPNMPLIPMGAGISAREP